MIKFRNFRDVGPYNPEEVQIVVHAICNLLKIQYYPLRVNIDAYQISCKMIPLFIHYNVVKNPTYDWGGCSCMLQDLIELLVQKQILSLSQIESETQKVSETYPPIPYPAMQ